MSKNETPQDTDWFGEMAKRLATDENFVKAYMEDLNNCPFTEQAQKDIAKYLESENDMFDYLLTNKQKQKGEKQMTNEEKYKTSEERSAAFLKACKGECSRCKYNENKPGSQCHFVWLATECNEPDLPFRVQPIFGGGSIIVETLKGSKVFDEMQGFAAQLICSTLNDAAIAWHKHEVEKGGCDEN